LSQASLDFLNLFVRTPGDIIYFLVAIGLSQAGLFMALGEKWRNPKQTDSNRYTLAMLGIVLTWVVLMLGALFGVVANQSTASILPPLERAGNLLIIALSLWAFITADTPPAARSFNLLLLGVIILVGIGYALTGMQWLGSPSQDNFNLTTLSVLWTTAAVILIVIALVLIIINFRYVTDAPLKLLFFLILGVGYGGTVC
jgi:hypothetical protein